MGTPTVCIMRQWASRSASASSSESAVAAASSAAVSAVARSSVSPFGQCKQIELATLPPATPTNRPPPPPRHPATTLCVQLSILAMSEMEFVFLAGDGSSGVRQFVAFDPWPPAPGLVFMPTSHSIALVWVIVSNHFPIFSNFAFCAESQGLCIFLWLTLVLYFAMDYYIAGM